jgi:hypothetical protein
LIKKLEVTILVSLLCVFALGQKFASGQSSSLVKILSHSSYIDDIGYLHVVGEVENGSPLDIEFVKVVGTFYDSNNTVVGTTLTYTNPSDVSGGQKAPFDLILSGASIPIPEIGNYSLQVNFEPSKSTNVLE